MVEGTATGASSRSGPLARLSADILSSLFYYKSDRLSVAVRWLVSLGLLVFGLLVWTLFYHRGDIALDFLDWAEVTAPRYALLQDAATRGILPLHAGNQTALRGVTDRYFSIADTPFSPQYLLLGAVSIGVYLMLDTLLFYLAGFVGLLLVQRRYRLSPFAFTVLFLLFNFNGSIVIHLAVGHSIWVAYFLTPFFALLALDLAERGQVGWKWYLGLSGLMLVILMQGGFHLYLWCLMFLALMGLYNPRLIKPIALGGLFSILVGLWRILPPTLALGGLANEYLGGFTTLTDLLTGLVVLKDPDRSVMFPSKVFMLSWWELDYFIGLIGFGILVFFGIILPLLRERSPQSMPVRILLPALTLTALSVGRVYWVLIKLLPLPPFTGERVTSRFFLLAFVFFLFLAVIFLQRELDRRTFQPWVRVAFLAGLLVMFHDLMRHLESWWIRFIDGLTYIFPKVPVDITQHRLANHADPIYIAMLVGGAAASLIVLGFLTAMTLRERRRERRHEQQAERS